MKQEDWTKKAIVVDDSQTARKTAKDLLTKCGYDEIIEMGQGDGVVELYKRVNPKLIIIDLVLPDLDGLSLVGQLRAIDKDGKIIVQTASATPKRIKSAYENGANFFLIKPYLESEFCEVIKKFD